MENTLLPGKYDLQEELRRWLSGAVKVVVAGIGNPLRMDDSVGTKIVQNLKGRVSGKVLLIECETVPESFMNKIVDFSPSHVLLIDAGILGLEPGESRLINPESLEFSPPFSTHTLPLRIFCESIKQMIEAKISLLLVEPKLTDFGEGLTPEVEKAEKRITKILLDVLKII
jgi:hydrogenase 3 maturation protease